MRMSIAPCRTNHVAGIELHPHQVRLTHTAQSIGGAAHVLVLQGGGRLCIDAVTEHIDVFSYLHYFSGFPPLNNYNTAASGSGQMLIKRSGCPVSESLSESASSSLLWPALTLHFNNKHHHWSQVIRIRTVLMLTSCLFDPLLSLWDTCLNLLHNTRLNLIDY